MDKLEVTTTIFVLQIYSSIWLLSHVVKFFGNPMSIWFLHFIKCIDEMELDRVRIFFEEQYVHEIHYISLKQDWKCCFNNSTSSCESHGVMQMTLIGNVHLVVIKDRILFTFTES